MTAAAARIAALDPARDAREIVFLLGAYEFAWDIERALEFALFRTYAVPSISGLLARTGEFERRTRKRYDDTELILAEMTEHGFDHPRGAAALARMNEMHGRFRIGNDDMRYVLSTFVCEPVRWLDRYGRRPLTAHERQAWVAYYRQLGRRMGIADIPVDLAAFEALNRAYEAAHFRYADTNRRIASVTTDLLLGFYLPRRLIPLGRPSAHVFMDPPLREAIGAPTPPRWLSALILAAMATRRHALRLLPGRRRPHLLTRVRRPTYPAGYRVEDLGTVPPRPRRSASATGLAEDPAHRH